MYKYFLLIFTLFYWTNVAILAAQTLDVVTEELPPFNYLENGEVKGLSTEIVKAVFKELNITPNIEVFPWARALATAMEKPNVLIYSIGRNATREAKFKWVGIISNTNSYLFALKTRDDIQINSLVDAKKYTIGTVNEDFLEQYLIKNGFSKGKEIDSANMYELGFQKMMLGRLDLWPMNEYVAYWIVTKEGYSPNDILKKALVLTEASSLYYMAFGHNTSDELVERFRQALEKIKTSGEHDAIYKKYLQ